MNSQSSEIFKTQACRYIQMSQERIQNCCHSLDLEQLWYSPNDNTNSIGNLIIHLSGNIRQYILSGMGGAPDHRSRDEEFIADQKLPKDEILRELLEIIEKSKEVILEMDDERLQF